MRAKLTSTRLERPHADRGEAGVSRFRVFYLRINGRPSVVPAWRLRGLMHEMRMLNLAAKIERLVDGQSIEFDVAVYRRPVNLVARAGTWELRENRAAGEAAEAR